MSRYCLTTPIYYVNDVPHVGHAYTTIAADAVTRARRLREWDAFLLTGTDEHGQNIERIARERGVPEQQHCDEIAARFRALWQRLDVRYDRFIRTTDPLHKRGVLKLWSQLREAVGPDGRKAVYRGKYAGWYCPRCEGFKSEDELRQPGNLCPDHERPCEWTEEENLFFRLSAYQGWLAEEIGAGRIRIEPAGRRNEVLAVLKQGLQDFSISRARVKWGIAVPEEPDHVFYVWMDALANYITALGYGEEGAARRPYLEYWESATERFHLVGKEIIRFHCLYWPAMLEAAGLPVPTRLFAHGHLTKNGKKLSKTTGNVIDPEALVDRYGPDPVRYFLLREGSFGQDWDFTDEAFLGRYNADLANDLGNLVSRALTMVEKYCGGRVPLVPTTAARGLQLSPDVRARILDCYEHLDFSGALTQLWAEIRRLNQEVVQAAPWELAKDPGQKGVLDSFLGRLLGQMTEIATLVSPVMPRAAERIYRMLGLAREPQASDLAGPVLKPGAPLGVIEALFPRVEKEKTVSETRPPLGAPSADAPATGPAPSAEAGGPAPVTSDKVDIADFAKLELRAARITSAERVAGSKKLIKLEVDLGTETRQVVAGIAETYTPESLVGKTVAVVANLKPAKLMGVESNGMVLAASVDGRAVLCTFDRDVAPGTRVK